jgi:hypothetical protein
MALRDVAVSSLKRRSFDRAPADGRSLGRDGQVNGQVNAANQSGTTLRPRPPSWRFAAVHMGPAAFLWLVGGWVVAVAVLLAGVVVLRHLV